MLTSCGKNVLTYKYRLFYKENSVISGDSIFSLHQKVCYNNPTMIDEEFCYYLKLQFLDTTAAKKKKTLDLINDSNIINAEYGIFSIWNWNWSDVNNKVTGKVKIIRWDRNGITIKKKIIALDYRRDKTQKFIGKRTYRRYE